MNCQKFAYFFNPVGLWLVEKQKWTFLIKSFYGEFEKKQKLIMLDILQMLAEYSEKYFLNTVQNILGRMLINLFSKSHSYGNKMFLHMM